METYESAHAALLQGNAQETIRILNERSLAYAQAAQKDGASAQEQQQALMNGYEGQLQAIQLYLQHAKEGKIQFNESELQLMMDLSLIHI